MNRYGLLWQPAGSAGQDLRTLLLDLGAHKSFLLVVHILFYSFLIRHEAKFDLR